LLKIEEIWLEYHNRLFAFIKKRVDESEAEDILQDVFTKIFSRIDTIKDNIKIENWIYQITRNAVIDYYRGKKKNIKLEDWVETTQFDDNDNIFIRSGELN